jgi:hypothetical protein
MRFRAVRQIVLKLIRIFGIKKKKIYYFQEGSKGIWRRYLLPVVGYVVNKTRTFLF